MTYHLIDLPLHFPKQKYYEAIEFMAAELLNTGKVKSIYQVGGISTPGISDIDLFVVFHDNSEFAINPVSNLKSPYNYFFSHRLFGTSEKMAVTLEQYTLFGAYNFIAGKPVELMNYHATESETAVLKKQIAIEYLVKAWLSNAISMKFGYIKVRNLLLHAKATLLDLAFLELPKNELSYCIGEIMEVRNTWFDKPASAKQLTQLVKRFDKALESVILTTIASYNFYLPDVANLQISKRIKIQHSQQLKLNREGILLPLPLTRLITNLQKVQNKTNRFKLQIPTSRNNIPDILLNRHNQIKEAFIYNHKFLPCFIPTGQAMNIFNKE